MTQHRKGLLRIFVELRRSVHACLRDEEVMELNRLLEKIYRANVQKTADDSLESSLV